eukprot:TRINITY_DN2115_c0_g1_i3.p1 TRINITY_DN2115_c0_g1~~TRINITY_DN2115_c0_g1_i3.p1  ORF type:complete len:161 (-),score=45.72 TRINITY_DN2115_c0_g1_i3:54-536(-)
MSEDEEKENIQSTLNLTEDQYKELKAAFALFDEDGDGGITKVEIAKVMQSLGLNPEESEIEAMIREFDEDGNGEIDFAEFSTMMTQKLSESTTEETIPKVFDVFDEDKKGFITDSDLMRVIDKLGEDISEEEARDFFELADEKGQGQIDYESFTKIMLAC